MPRHKLSQQYVFDLFVFEVATLGHDDQVENFASISMSAAAAGGQDRESETANTGHSLRRSPCSNEGPSVNSYQSWLFIGFPNTERNPLRLGQPETPRA